MSTNTASRPALERNWWLRAVTALVAPRPIFASLRDESTEAIEARQEILAAIAVLAAISVALASHTFRQILNAGGVSPIVIAVLAFIAGLVFGMATYWVGGGLLYGACRRFGSEGSFLRSRHVLALAATPLALSLVVFWPVRIAVYGEDLFRTGGDDYGRGDAIFGGVFLGFVAWSVMLLIVGIRAVHGWSWARATGAVALAAAAPVLLVVATSV